jgi:cytochrome c
MENLNVSRVLGVMALMPILPAVANAQAAGDPEAGLRVARQWCTGCHIVESGGRGSDSGPPFHEVANRPDRTPATMRAWLTDPHPPMPNLNLTNKEINDVIAYLESLKGHI